MSTPSQRLPSAVRFLRAGAKAALLSAIFSAIGLGFWLLATGGSVRRFLVEPELLVDIGVNAAEAVRFAALFWLFGLSLAFLVVALTLRLVIRAKSPVAGDLVSLAGIGAALAAGFAALMLASIGPALIGAFAEPTRTTDVEAVRQGFAQLTSIAIGGLWQTVFGVAAGAWWIGVAVLVPWERTVVKPLAILVGACALASAITHAIGLAEPSSVAFVCAVVLWIPAMVFVGRELRVPLAAAGPVGDPRMN